MAVLGLKSRYMKPENHATVTKPFRWTKAALYLRDMVRLVDVPTVRIQIRVSVINGSLDSHAMNMTEWMQLLDTVVDHMKEVRP